MDEKKNETAPPKSLNRWLFVLAAIWIVSLIYNANFSPRGSSALPYDQFLSQLDAGKIESLHIGRETIIGVYKGTDDAAKKEFVVQRIDDPELLGRLTKAKVHFEGMRESVVWREALSWILPFLLLWAFWSFLFRRMGNLTKGGVLGVGKSKARIYVEKDVPTRFSDVAGIDEAKFELQEMVSFLKDPQKYNRLGGRVPKGILLVGPPGTGKTLVARAVAGEANVPFFSINGSEFVELFVGLGAARVRDLFTEARASTPCILFIDELDALGKMRSVSGVTGSNDEKEQTLNQLLAEIDGFDPSKGIVLLAATNRPEVLDPALLRSGRFDKQILIDKPDRVGRRAILEIHARGIKLGSAVNLDEIARLTTGFSGADLANLVNEAAVVATRRGAESVEMEDFTVAVERIVAGLERKTRLLNPEEKKRVAHHEMGHATASFALGDKEIIHKVSVIPRGSSALGYTMHLPEEDRYILSRQELEVKLGVLLGGRAAEEIFLETVSTGAADDLDKATELARAMVTRFGMGETLGLATYEKPHTRFLGAETFPAMGQRDYSEQTAEQIDREVRHLLDEAYSRATGAIVAHGTFLQEGAAQLLAKETLTQDELRELWETRQGKPKSKTNRTLMRPVPIKNA